MSMYETARSLKAQEQQRKLMARHGLWPDATTNDSIVRKIRNITKHGRKC